MCVEKEDGTSAIETKRGKMLMDKVIKLENRVLISFFEFDYDEMQKCQFVEKKLLNPINNMITFNILKPGEFKVYRFVSK